MGGDLAPQATVAGALLALAELDPAHSIQLVGSTPVVEEQLRSLLAGELASHAVHRDRLSIIEAPEVVEMNDKPTAAVRGKPNSSMAVGLRLQTEGQSDAFVSAGSTGRELRARFRSSLKTFFLSSMGRSIRLSRDWKRRAGLRQNGVFPRVIAGRASTR